MSARMMIRLTVCAALVASAPTMAFAADAPSDSKVAEARSRYDRAMHLYEDKDFEAARAEFQRAMDLAPSYRILYNIGVCDGQLNDYVSAVKNLQKYLADGGTEVPNARREEVESVLADYRPKIAHVTVKVEEGTSVSIDDVSVGVAPLSTAVDVNPGRRKISVSKKGRFPQTRSIVIAGSETQPLSFDLESTETKVMVGGPTSPNYVPVVLWTATAALGAGAAITGMTAIRASNHLQYLDNTTPVASSQLEDDRTKMRTFSIVADVLTGAAIVGLGVSLFVTLYHPKKATSGEVKAAFKAGGFAFSGSF